MLRRTELVAERGVELVGAGVAICRLDVESVLTVVAVLLHAGLAGAVVQLLLYDGVGLLLTTGVGHVRLQLLQLALQLALSVLLVRGVRRLGGAQLRWVGWRVVGELAGCLRAVRWLQTW